MRWSKNRWRRLLRVGALAFTVLICTFAVISYYGHQRRSMERQIITGLLLKDPTASIADDYVPGWRYQLQKVLVGSRTCEMSLHGSCITDADLAEAASLSDLRSLSLDGCHITDAGVRDIAKIRALECLYLYNCKDISDASLSSIGRLASLELLTISGCDRITGRSLGHLAGLKRLGTLSLCGSKITDEAVGYLESLKQLDDTLDIRGTAISARSVSELQHVLPGVQVLSSP
jgi:hypothetical protein